MALMLTQVAGMWFIYTTALFLHQELKAIRLSDCGKWEELNLTQDEFERSVKEEEELIVDGVFYDLVSVQHTPEGIRAIAVRDTGENKLQATLDSIQHDTNGWSALAHLAFEFSFSPFIIETASVSAAAIITQPLDHCAYYLDLNSMVFLPSLDYPPII